MSNFQFIIFNFQKVQSVLPEFSNWQPWSLETIKRQLHGLEWILAGGFALELYCGTNYRPHEDIDIIIKRSNQKRLIQYFDLDQLFIAYRGNLTPFSTDEFYKKPIQDIWVLSEDGQNWCLQIMLVDEAEGNWIYKRNSKIQLPFEVIYFEREGIKALKPEIQFLYKSKNIRAKDQLDFEMIYGQLSKKAKDWLQMNLEKCYDKKHSWLCLE